MDVSPDVSPRPQLPRLFVDDDVYDPAYDRLSATKSAISAISARSANGAGKTSDCKKAEVVVSCLRLRDCLRLKLHTDRTLLNCKENAALSHVTNLTDFNFLPTTPLACKN